MTVSADDVRAVAATARSDAEALRADIRWGWETARDEIRRHWLGLAAVQANVAMETQLAGIAVCADVLDDLARSLDRLAMSVDRATVHRAAARRLADEAGGWAGELEPGWTDALPEAVRTGVEQLLRWAKDEVELADLSCAEEIDALTSVAPQVISAPEQPRWRATPPGSWRLDLPPPDRLLAAWAAAARPPRRPPVPRSVIGDAAEAALSPQEVAADPSRGVAAREIAARMELESAATSGDPRRAAEARTLLYDGQGSARTYALYDPKRGSVAEVVGELASARTVVVLVPGVGSSVDTWPAVRTQIEALYEALRAESGGGVAVVGWLGSPAPSNILVAARASYAKAAGPSLRDFVAGLGVPSKAITLVGHSYGAVVAGEAIRDGLRPAAVVGVAGPGLGPGVRSSADLFGTPTYVLTDPRDPINDVQPVQSLLGAVVEAGLPMSPFTLPGSRAAVGTDYLGVDPIRLPGAIRLSTGTDRVPRPLIATDVDVHGNYFTPGGFVDRQIAAVALGLPVVPYDGPPGR